MMLKVGTDLYRQLLQQARRLPDGHAAAFYRDQIRSTFRQPVEAEGSKDAVRRVQKANKLLRQLTAANDGYLHALTRALNAAYGRTGKAKHLAIQPFLPSTHLPQPTTFSPLLATLLQSAVAHTARPPTPAALRTPPTLPPRAVPGSEEARLLGQLPLQRERAVRGRYWREQVGKLRAPVAVAVDRQGREGEGGREEVEAALGAAGVRMTVEEVEKGVALLRRLEEGSRVREEDRPLLPRRLRAATLHKDAATRSPRPATPKPQRKTPATHPPQLHSSKWHNPKIITPRLLRNRLAQILHDAPIVIVASPPVPLPFGPTAGSGSSSGEPGHGRATQPPRVSVARSGWAKGGVERYSPLGEEGEWWLATFGEAGGKKGRGVGKAAPGPAKEKAAAVGGRDGEAP